MTIKGMEAQLAKILSSHQQQIAQLKEQTALQIKQADERAFSQYTQQVEDLRQILLKEQEAHTQKELEAAKNRYERMMEEERASLEGNRRRIMLEREEERNHLEELLAKCKSELIDLKKDREDTITKMKEEHSVETQQLAKDLDTRYKTQMEEMARRGEEEKKSWEEHNNSMYEAKIIARERDLRMQLKKERDQQIQLALTKLETKVLEDEKMIEAQAESKIKRLTDRYENEINQLEASERSMSEKYTQIKAQNLELVTERDRLKVQFGQKDQQLQELDQVYEKLNKERCNLQDVIRQEFADRLVSLDSENKRMKNKLAELKATLTVQEDTHASDMAKLKADNETAMEQVRCKIRELSEKKESELSSLKTRYQAEVDELEAQLDSANRRVGHFEELMDEQRKQLLLLNQQASNSTKKSTFLKK
ncbi:Centrosomal protein of 131 kDa [Cichlidogyrus casuarinus]|uniref:Centrosomal protein of 131 kDa n=1 Tax=Cichlidogyrus casuarinus TaxID=1844966 RepID=A0ABD2PS02_9PLAT